MTLRVVCHVTVCVRLETAADLVSKMIGYKLKTKQTSADGVTVNKVWDITNY